jgi:hypothetical protein
MKNLKNMPTFGKKIDANTDFKIKSTQSGNYRG